MPKFYRATLESTEGTDSGIIVLIDVDGTVTYTPPSGNAGKPLGLLLVLTHAA